MSRAGLSFQAVRYYLGVAMVFGLAALYRAMVVADFGTALLVATMMFATLIPLATGFKPKRWEITWEEFAEIKARTWDEFIAYKIKLGF